MKEGFLNTHKIIPLKFGKYSLSDEASWHKFALEKKSFSGGVTFPSEPAYPSTLEINSSKVDDLKKIVYRFIPREFREFYDSVISANTEESASSQDLPELSED